MTRGMMNLMEDEAELATVLGHAAAIPGLRGANVYLEADSVAVRR